MVQQGQSRQKHGKNSSALQNLSSFVSLASSVGSSTAAAYRAVQPHIRRALDAQHQALNGDNISQAQRTLISGYQEQPLSENASHYSPLPTASSIRLLTIQPGDAAPIHCSLRVVDLGDSPKFKALSYSWGKDESWIENATSFFSSLVTGGSTTSLAVDSEDPAQDLTTRPIQCNGQLLNVHQNLHSALMQLRKSSSGEYWIDAVCINQDDLVERSHQVQIMGLIYSCAERVSVWLGDCDGALSPAMAKLEKDQGILTPLRLPITARELMRLPEAIQRMAAVVYLLSRRYFSRVWVLQEVCLAKEIEIIIGAHCISQETLIRLVERPHGQAFNRSEHVISMMHSSLQMARPFLASASAVPLLLHARERMQKGETLTLDQWLELIKGRGATDPRDFVNAGLGLIRPSDLYINQNIHLRDAQEDIRLWSKLDVNYSLKSSEVLLNLAACMLSKPCGIRLLSFSSRVRDALGGDADYSAVLQDAGMWTGLLGSTASKVQEVASKTARIVLREAPGPDEGDAHDLAAMPSWVPNPSARSCTFLDTFSSQGITHFAACTSLDDQSIISSDMRTLYVDAADLGAIDTLCSLPLVDYDHVPLLKYAATVPSQYWPTGESGLEALAETCLAGTWPKVQDRSALRGLLRLFKRGDPDVPHMAKLLDRKALKLAYGALETAHKELHWDELRNLAGEELGLRFHKDGSKLMMWRSIFTTQDGYMGLGPSWLAKGDHVMLVKGAHVPYIFRHINDILIAKSRIIRNELADQKVCPSKERREFLEDALTRVEEEFGRIDAWVLIGEAYIRGVMEGQAITPMVEFQRIGII